MLAYLRIFVCVCILMHHDMHQDLHTYAYSCVCVIRLWTFVEGGWFEHGFPGAGVLAHVGAPATPR